jgi:hypothetical protein
VNPNIFVNVFSPEDFVQGPDGLSRLKDSTDIYRKIRELCETHDLSYMWAGQNSGYNPQGIPFFVGNLTFVDLKSKVLMTHTGSAESPVKNGAPAIGLSGCALIALNNAFLRGFGAAEFLYETEQHMRTSPPPAPRTPSATVSPPKTIATVAQAREATQDELEEAMAQETARNLAAGQASREAAAAPKPFVKRAPGPKAGGAAPKPYSGKQTEWTGYGADGTPVCIKTGANAGKAWIDMPIEYINKLANMPTPNEVAKKELERRMKASGRTPQVANPFVQEETNDDW